MRYNIVLNGKVIVEGSEQFDRLSAIVEATSKWQEKIESGEFTGLEEVQVVAVKARSSGVRETDDEFSD